MDVTLPLDVKQQVEEELARGRFHSSDELIVTAVRYYLDDRLRGERRLEALRGIGQAVDEAGLYERVFVPAPE